MACITSTPNTQLNQLRSKLDNEKSAYLKMLQIDDVKAWFKAQAPEARYFLSLTFSDNVTRIEAEKAARTFQHEVSRAIAGTAATRNGRYIHKMSVALEQQKLGRWHLHIMMDALPSEYNRIIYVDDLKMACAKIWQRFRFKKKPPEAYLLRTQSKNAENDITAVIAGEHSSKWFQELMTDDDIENCFEYSMKTYAKQGSDFFGTTH